VVPRVEIHQQFGQIAIEIVLPETQVRCKAPELSLHTDPLRIEIAPGRVELEISYEQPQADLGFYRPLPFARCGGEEGKEAALRAVAAYAGEGDRIAQIEDPNFSFAELVQAMWERAAKELNIGSIRPPQVRVEVMPLRVFGEPGELQLQVAPGDIHVEFSWGYVEPRLVVPPKVGLFLDTFG